MCGPIFGFPEESARKQKRHLNLEWTRAGQNIHDGLLRAVCSARAPATQCAQVPLQRVHDQRTQKHFQTVQSGRQTGGSQVDRQQRIQEIQDSVIRRIPSDRYR